MKFSKFMNSLLTRFDTPGNLIGQNFQIEIHVQKAISRQQMKAQTLGYLECLSYT